MLVFQARPAPAPTSLDRRLACWVFAQHAVPYIRSTQRHSHTCFFEEPTGSFAACYKVSRRYTGDGSLRLELCSPQPGHESLRFKRRSAGDGSLRHARRSSQPEHGSLRFKRRSAGDGSPCFQRRSPQLRHYSSDGSLRVGRRSSQPWHGARAPSAAPPSHAQRSSQPAAPARLSFQRGCPTPPPPGHAVAVNLRFGKADTEAPGSMVKLDSAFPGNSGGRYPLFPVKE